LQQRVRPDPWALKETLQTIAIASDRFSDQTFTVACISFHALSRRFQRGSRHPNDVLDDLLDYTRALFDRMLGSTPDEALTETSLAWKTDTITIDGTPCAGIRTFVE
jgi:hypothetical protein